MTKFILVRHGQTAWNNLGRYQGHTDVPLSEEGYAQAEKLAANFPVKDVSAIYSSDLSRAMVTAEKIAAQFHLPVQQSENLRELNFGRWEGLTYSEIVKKDESLWQAFWKNPGEVRVPEGENFSDLEKRVMGKVKAIAADHDGETVVLVAHGAVIRTIICSALHAPLKYVWSIRVYNTALSIVTTEEDVSYVDLVNSTAHLD